MSAKSSCPYISTGIFNRHIFSSFQDEFNDLCLSLLDNIELESVYKTLTMLDPFSEKENVLKACKTSESCKHLFWYLKTAVSSESTFYLLINLLKPRIDMNVTTQSNHLIKSPYSVHPNTGTISNLI